MLEPPICPDSLVLYRNRPARVRQIGEKLEIEREGSQTVKVRPKDVMLLHPGPVHSLDELRPPASEAETAWELLVGESTTLADLAELAYGTYTPATAWAAWQLLADGLYFRGTPDEVVARSPEEVARERAAREARAAGERAWAAFLERARAGRMAPEDSQYLQEVEELALGRRDRSRVLRDLGRAETPESAHALLLELGRWDHTVNPYPQRLRLTTSPPTVDLPDLPDETRADLTYLPAFAIDDEGNQDPDDALSLEVKPGGCRLWVHVADVSALARPDSPADREAQVRGATLYLPESTVPMLPVNATQVLGLGLNEVSPALSFGLDLCSTGEIAGVEIVPSWVRAARLTYEEAEAQLQDEPFQSLYRLAQVHQARRRGCGAIFIELPEVKIRVVSGEVIIRPLLPLRSRVLVEEAMLMAGEAVARFALEQDIPLPFTTQEPPETDEQPTDMAGMYALRRVLKRSVQSSVPGPHAGLGLAAYVQATSPLRRYLDLVVHQQVRAHLRGEAPLGTQEVLERVGAAMAVTGSVRQAERLARRHWTLVYLMEQPGWRGEGVLVDKRGLRGTVLIPALDLEAPVHLREDRPLNGLLPIALREVNLAELEVHFQVVG